MPRLPSFDPYDFLVARKFPGFTGREVLERHDAHRAMMLTPENALEKYRSTRQLTPVEKAALKKRSVTELAAAQYRDELLLLSADQIDEQVKSARALAAREAEQNLFFNRIDAQADFEHYCRAATWTLDECVALSFAKDPTKVNWESVSPYVPHHPFAKQYERRRDLCMRALAAQQLSDPVYPTNFLAWAKEIRIELPEQLISAAVNQGISLIGWKELYDEQVNVTNAVKQELLEANAEVERLRPHNLATARSSNEANSATTRERNTLMKLVIGMAIKGYLYDPRRPRNSATADIRNDLEGLGIPIDGLLP